MEIKWSYIKEKMYRYTYRTFEEQGIRVSDKEINECIDIFIRW